MKATPPHFDPQTLFPPNIRKIAVIAPASLCAHEKLIPEFQAVRACGIELDLSYSLEEPNALPYLAAPDEIRAESLNRALQSDADMIWCVRGGYGSMRILDQIRWSCNPSKILIGFSDITALLLAMCVKNVGRPIAGFHIGRFQTEIEYPETRESFQWALHPQGKYCVPMSSKKIYQTGTVQGPLYAVNLSIFESLIGTPWLPDLAGAVLIIEDVGEPLRKIDRFLAHLKLAGILEKLGGLLFGYFTESDHDDLRHEVFAYYAQSVKGPVADGVPFGHTSPIVCLPMGATCRVNAEKNNVELTILSQS